MSFSEYYVIYWIQMSFSKETNTVTERNLYFEFKRKDWIWSWLHIGSVDFFLHSQEIILIPYDIVTNLYESL